MLEFVSPISFSYWFVYGLQHLFEKHNQHHPTTDLVLGHPTIFLPTLSDRIVPRLVSPGQEDQ